MNIPEEITARLPLFTLEHMDLYLKLRENESAPIWNYTCGDRINKQDLHKIELFAEQLRNKREKGNLEISDEILHWLEKIKDDVILFKENTKELSIRNEFSKIKCMKREDIAKSLEKVVPLSISLDRLIVNSTSGTSGHPIITPNHPAAIGCYTPLLLFSLSRHGVEPIFTRNNVGCMLICSQKETAVYSTVVPMLNGTGFAKINLDLSSWRQEKDRIQYIEEFNPEFLTGDPFSFSELLKLDIKYKPKALVSTSMNLNSYLREELIKKFNTKVIDYYSLNETGPLAYSCPHNPEEFHILPTDIFLEITDGTGNPLPENTSGEITVTGGRNPYIPLLRYKTGDRAKLKLDKCNCGDPMPRLYDMETRELVLFYNKNRKLVNPIDITRIIKNYPILQYEFKQNKDLSCVISIHKLYDFSKLQEQNFRKEINTLFDNSIDLEINFQLNTNGLKSIPYISES